MKHLSGSLWGDTVRWAPVIPGFAKLATQVKSSLQKKGEGKKRKEERRKEQKREGKKKKRKIREKKKGKANPF